MTVNCPYCSKPAQLVDGKVIYPHRQDLVQKMFWQCAPCGAYVGCHEGTETPLGRLANAELRRAKIAAHAAFDPLWRSEPHGKRNKARNNAYAWLSRVMGLPPEQTHISMMDVEQCQRVVQHCMQLQFESDLARENERII